MGVCDDDPGKADVGGSGRARRHLVRDRGADARRAGQCRLARAAAVCIYFIAYRFYALFITTRCSASTSTGPRPRTAATTASTTCRPTGTCCSATISRRSPAPARWSARCSPRRWATCPGTLWILAGVVFAGAVQDMTVLFLSTRRDGRSLGEMIRAEMGPIAGTIAGIGVLLICIIVLAVLALVVVKALDGQPMGHVHRVLHHPDRAADGRLQPLHPARPHRRDVGDRRRAAAGRAGLRPDRLRDARRSPPGSTCPAARWR